MAFEIIALDMDGTLLDSRKRVLPSSVAAVERAAAAGKTVAICSGRCPVMVTKYRDELPGVRYAICCAGAVIYDMEHDRVVDETNLDPAFISHALDVAEEEGFFLLEVTSGTGIYMQADEMSQAARCGVGIYEQLYHETSTVIADAHAFARRPDVPQSKLNFHFADVAARDRCRARLEGSGVVITNCERSSMEFSAPGIDKGVGLARLAALLGVPEASDEEIERARARIERKRRKDQLTSGLCACIMIVATIAGLVMLFVPEYETPYFWLAWAIGGLLCAVAAIAVGSFVKDQPSQ